MTRACTCLAGMAMTEGAMCIVFCRARQTANVLDIAAMACESFLPRTCRMLVFGYVIPRALAQWLRTREGLHIFGPRSFALPFCTVHLFGLYQLATQGRRRTLEVLTCFIQFFAGQPPVLKAQNFPVKLGVCTGFVRVPNTWEQGEDGSFHGNTVHCLWTLPPTAFFRTFM